MQKTPPPPGIFTANPNWGDIFVGSKLEPLFYHVSVKRDVRALILSFENSIRKCHPKWDRLYMQEETYHLVKRDISTCEKRHINLSKETFQLVKRDISTCRRICMQEETYQLVKRYGSSYIHIRRMYVLRVCSSIYFSVDAASTFQ